MPSRGRRSGRSYGASEIANVATCEAVQVPYAIIMVIPLSPPGHVFAFSLLNRVFPGAVPSGFTAERQDIKELYARIADEAADKPYTLRLPRLPIRRAQRVAKRAVRGLRARASARGELRVQPVA